MDFDMRQIDALHKPSVDAECRESMIVTDPASFPFEPDKDKVKISKSIIER